MVPKIKTRREAARIIGRTAPVITRWVGRGYLPPPPWTVTQLRGALAKANKHPYGLAETSAPHGTSSRWRGGCNCAECAAAHNADSIQMRHAQAVESLDGSKVMAALRGGCHPRDLEETTGAGWLAVLGRAAWDTGWATQVDEAVRSAVPADTEHGTRGAYQNDDCRCSQCRAWKAGDR